MIQSIQSKKIQIIITPYEKHLKTHPDGELRSQTAEEINDL